MRLHRGFPRRHRPTEPSARSRSRLRERPTGRERERARGGRPSSTARRPARSERPAHSPFAATQPRPSRAASPGSAGPERVKRWRRGHMHFSPERAQAVRRAPARPEWSVASDAEGGTRRAGRAVEKHPSIQVRRLVTQPTSWWTQKGRGRLGHRESKLSRANGAKRRGRSRAFRIPVAF